jgi:Na+-translocating ferredoxin:NAD+ oxidoreductase RnfC subunit
MLSRIRDAGVVGAGGGGFPTAVKYDACMAAAGGRDGGKSAGACEFVIANGAECEPLARNDQHEMVEHPAEILRGLQIALQMIGLALVDGGIELDQHIARTDALAVRDPDGAHDASLEGLDHLAVAGRYDLAGGGGHDVHMAQARPPQRQREQGDNGRPDRPTDG